MITVAICTYNRCDSLRRTLDSLSAQIDIEWSQVEVLVLDNNCTDGTAALVASFEDCLPVRRTVEVKQGLSHARNCALSVANGTWVIFADDDVILDARWLSLYVLALSDDASNGYAGGRILPDWQGVQPPWFRGENLALLDGVLVWFDLGTGRRALRASDPLPFGANFAVRREVFARIGPFRIDMGVKGTAYGRGEETEWMARARASGVTGLYVGDAVCWHAVDAKRFEIPALFRYGLASAKAIREITDPAARGTASAAALYAIRGLVQLARGRGDRFRQCVINAGIQMGLRRGRSV